MPPLPPPDLSLADVATVLRASEDRTSAHRGQEGAGHAHGRHVALTRADLWNRVNTDARNGQVALFTAFVSTADQVAAARETLNSVEGKWARHQFKQAPGTPRGSHNGMFARIFYSGQTRIVRYAGGTGTMPMSDCQMIVARDDARPHGLHIKTFFATMRESAPAHRVTVYNRDNSEFSRGP